MILTLKELAEYLRVNERTIMRMKDQGKIEGVKIGGQWRFNGSEIDKLFFPQNGVEVAKEVEQEEPMSVLNRPSIGIPLSRVMHENRILLNLAATDRDSLIEEMTAARLMYGLVLDVSDLRLKCKQREAVLSTAIGEGIAIPHPRDPIPTLRSSAAVIYGYSHDGINYDAPDGKPVHHFFLVCSQNIELHLHLMGCMARLLKDQDFVNALPKCTQNADVIKLVMKHERAEFAPAASR
ncbi:MAG: PTS sugar transporter subunit IIA [Victivallales bacterium]|nr:PTS sugar transporter subunit IIA [Victivallales bacterium]